MYAVLDAKKESTSQRQWEGKQRNTVDLVLIPGGYMTSPLLMLEIVVNKPFMITLQSNNVMCAKNTYSESNHEGTSNQPKSTNVLQNNLSVFFKTV